MTNTYAIHHSRILAALFPPTAQSTLIIEHMHTCPQELQLFLCWDSEGIEEREDTIVEELFNCVDKDISDSERRPRAKTTKKKKRRHSSVSEDEDSKSSSSVSKDSSKSSSSDPCLFDK